MQELMLLLASVMPEDMIIDMLSNEIAAYKLNKTPEQRSKITSLSMLLAGKEAIDNTTGGVDKIMDDMNKMKQGMDLLNPKKN